MFRSVWRVLDPFDRRGGFVLPHIALLAVLALGLILSGVFVAHQVGAGLKPAPLPASKHVTLRHVKLRGGLPFYASLERFQWFPALDQGSSNSCTGQTTADMRMIQHFEETGQRVAVNPWAVYGQCNGGVDQGASYDCIFPTAVRFGYFHNWRWLSPTDYYSMEVAIATGHVIAWASAWYSSLSSAWGTDYVYSNTGSFQFNHSTSLIGYQVRDGQLYFLLLNSYGQSWGSFGRVWVPASVIGQGFAGVITDYDHNLLPHSAVRHHRAGFRHKAWHQYRVAAHKKLISPWNPWRDGGLSRTADLWYHHGNGRGTGGIVSPQQWNGLKRTGRAMMTARFQSARLYWWPGTKWHKWVRVHLIPRPKH